MNDKKRCDTIKVPKNERVYEKSETKITWLQVPERFDKALSIVELFPIHEMQQRKQFLDVVLRWG